MRLFNERWKAEEYHEEYTIYVGEYKNVPLAGLIICDNGSYLVYDMNSNEVVRTGMLKYTKAGYREIKGG